jgi:hypothetical protein
LTRAPIVHFAPDPARRAVLAECTDHYDIGDPHAEWPNNILSRETIVYESGVIARRGAVVRHEVDPDELDRVRDIAGGAARMLAGVEVGMGSCGGPDPWHPFYVTANIGSIGSIGSSIDEPMIRDRFGGTIFPAATVRIEPLSEQTRFWSDFADYHDDEGPAERGRVLGAMRGVMRWLAGHDALVDRAFVMIGEAEQLWSVPSAQYPPGTEMTGCVLPRLILGLTRAGSLTGVFGHTVHT